MLPRRQALGYAEVTLTHDSLWGQAGVSLRGHEFHYSQIIEPADLGPAWRRVYQVRRPRGEAAPAEGFQRGNVLASYIHLHLAGHGQALECFLSRCQESSHGR